MAIAPIALGDTTARAKMNAAIEKANLVDTKADAAALTAEGQARQVAIAQETAARQTAIAQEAAARQAAILALPLPMPVENRPGDAPLNFGLSLPQGETLVPPIDAAMLRYDENGRVARLIGDAVLAQRHLFAVELGRRYLATFVVQRRVNSPDPDNDAIRCALAWYDAGKGRLIGGSGLTVVQDLLGLTTGSGRQVVRAVVSRAPGSDIDIVAPAAARYVRPCVQTFGTLVQNDVEVMSWADITDAQAFAPDVSALDGRVAAVESLNLGDRLDAAEAQIVAPNEYRVATISDFEAATVPVSADTVLVLGWGAPADGGGARYRRASAGSGPGKVQSADGAWWEIAEDIVKLDMLGAAGDGATSDQGAWAAAKAIGRPIALTEGRRYLVDDAANPDGVLVAGAGKLLTATTDGFQQHNSYSDAGKVFFGAEYLYRVWQRWFVTTQAQVPSLLRVNLFGDSTVQGTAATTAPYKLEVLLPELFRTRGIPNVSIDNYGVSGSTVPEIDLSPALTADDDLVIIKSWINDGPTGMEAAFAAADAKLTAFRANANGGVAAKSIIIVGPNPTNNDAFAINETYYEELRYRFELLCRKHKVAFFDTYAFLRDGCRGFAGLTMDDIGGGVAVHPKDHMQSWIWGAVIDAFFPRGAMARLAVNNFVNNGLIGEALAYGATPSQCRIGISYYACLKANGWPENGMVRVSKGVDGQVTQECITGLAFQTTTPMRIGLPVSDTWGPWTGTPLALTLANGWVAFDAGWHDKQIVLTRDGLAHVTMAIKSGVNTANTVIANLPSGIAPKKYMLVGATGEGGTAAIHPDGSLRIVTPFSGPSNVHMNFSFPTV